MFWFRSALLWLGGAVLALAHAQILPALATFPVQWQPLEEWRWQGQLIQSQRFSSSKSAAELTQILPELLQQELTALALGSARVINFFDQDRHFILFLSVQKKGTSGWLSSLELKGNPLQITPVFQGLYEHIWSMQAKDQSAVYVVVQPQFPAARAWHALQRRLKAQGWTGELHLCESSLPCEWRQKQQRLLLWQDSKHEFWHVLWWPS